MLHTFVGFQSHCERMAMVLRHCYPFKIVGAVVELVSILVVNLHVYIRALANKCSGHKVMNFDVFFPLILAEADLQIQFHCSLLQLKRKLGAMKMEGNYFPCIADLVFLKTFHNRPTHERYFNAYEVT